MKTFDDIFTDLIAINTEQGEMIQEMLGAFTTMDYSTISHQLLTLQEGLREVSALAVDFIKRGYVTLLVYAF